MDDLLALFDKSPVEENHVSTGREEGEEVWGRPKQRKNEEAQAAPKRNDVALSVDDRVGIRMINRNMSGLDLMNLITDYPYHSPAQLAAYSLTSLNGLLADPALVLDPATVCGKTELVTVGIVFSNSGTRVTASGNAFCIITMGSLSTGKAISCMLFGASYSKYCRLCVAGKVAALINPRLIPARTGKGETSITFSANDENQLIVVACARDYGCCKGSNRAKNANGQWVANGKQCRNFVDTRVGHYCQFHRKQQVAAGATSSSKGTSNSSRGNGLMQLRLQSKAFPTAQGNKMRKVDAGHTPALSAPKNTTGNNMPRPSQTAAQLRAVADRKLAGNLLLNPQQQASRRTTTTTTTASATTNRSTMTLGGGGAGGSNRLLQSSQGANSLLHPPSRRVTANPYAQQPKRSSCQGGVHMTATNTPKNQAPVQKTMVTGDILQQRKKSSKKGGSVKRLNTDVRGYNGSVAVPAPSAIFQRATAATPAAALRRPMQARKHDRSAADVVAQQKEVAALLTERKQAAERSTTDRPAKGKKKQKRDEQDANSRKAALKDSLFGASIDIEAVKAAKSQFANEADAEDYARSRQVVSELEKAEAKKDFNQQRKEKTSKKENLILKEWHCSHCKRSFQQKPMACLRSNHQVRVERKIRKEQSVGEKRLAMTERKAEDGGLRLGSGLDWSRNRFS